MSTSPQDKDDLWAGLEPEQPKNSRTAYWIALLAALLLLIGAVALTLFLMDSRSVAPDVLDSVDVNEPNDSVIVTADITNAEPTISTSATELPAIAPTVTLPALSTVSSQATAIRIPSPPIIDAILDEWTGLPASNSSSIVFTSSTWDGSDDLEVSWQLAWDENNLYVAATVVDDIHAQNQTGNTIFRGDSLDMQIDTNRAGDYGPALSPDDFQITFSPGDFAGLPSSAFRFQGTAGGDMLDATTEHNILVAAQPQGGGYILEASIPWRDLNVVPAAGMELGLALNATDNDQPGTATQEIMKSNAPDRSFGDPTTWGILILQ